MEERRENELTKAEGSVFYSQHSSAKNNDDAFEHLTRQCHGYMRYELGNQACRYGERKMQHVALAGVAGKVMILHDGSRANTTTMDSTITTREGANIFTF